MTIELKRALKSKIGNYSKIIECSQSPKITPNDKMPHEVKIEKGKKILREKILNRM